MNYGLSTWLAASPLLTAGDKFEIAMQTIPRSKIDSTDEKWQAAEVKEYDGIKDKITVVYQVPYDADLIPASTNYKIKRADTDGTVTYKVRILALGDQSWIEFERHEIEAITARRESLPLILTVFLTLDYPDQGLGDIGQAFLHGFPFAVPRYLRAPPC